MKLLWTVNSCETDLVNFQDSTHAMWLSPREVWTEINGQFAGRFKHEMSSTRRKVYLTPHLSHLTQPCSWLSCLCRFQTAAQSSQKKHHKKTVRRGMPNQDKTTSSDHGQRRPVTVRQSLLTAWPHDGDSHEWASGWSPFIHSSTTYEVPATSQVLFCALGDREWSKHRPCGGYVLVGVTET